MTEPCANCEERKKSLEALLNKKHQLQGLLRRTVHYVRNVRDRSFRQEDYDFVDQLVKEIERESQ